MNAEHGYDTRLSMYINKVGRRSNEDCTLARDALLTKVNAKV